MLVWKFVETKMFYDVNFTLGLSYLLSNHFVISLFGVWFVS